MHTLILSQRRIAITKVEVSYKLEGIIEIEVPDDVAQGIEKDFNTYRNTDLYAFQSAVKKEFDNLLFDDLKNGIFADDEAVRPQNAWIKGSDRGVPIF